jgi:hypothetical protein
LDYLLDNFQHNWQKGILKSEQKQLLRKNKSCYTKLTKSKQLLDIFKFMNKVDKTGHKTKRIFYSELQNLIVKLKDRCSALLSDKPKVPQYR